MSAKNGSSCVPYSEIILEIVGCGGKCCDRWQVTATSIKTKATTCICQLELSPGSKDIILGCLAVNSQNVVEIKNSVVDNFLIDLLCQFLKPEVGMLHKVLHWGEI